MGKWETHKALAVFFWPLTLNIYISTKYAEQISSRIPFLSHWGLINWSNKLMEFILCTVQHQSVSFTEQTVILTFSVTEWSKCHLTQKLMHESTTKIRTNLRICIHVISMIIHNNWFRNRYCAGNSCSVCDLKCVEQIPKTLHHLSVQQRVHISSTTWKVDLLNVRAAPLTV